jgi:hypothetical protein
MSTAPHVATNDDLIVEHLLRTLDVALGPVPDRELTARSGLTPQACSDAVARASAARYLEWSPAGWILLPAGWSRVSDPTW